MKKKRLSFIPKKMGFTFHSVWDGYMIFSRDEVQVHLWTCQNPEIPKNTGCYINVAMVDDLYNEYKSHNIIQPNGALTDMPWGMRQFFIPDNNGNIIHFGQDISGEEED